MLRKYTVAVMGYVPGPHGMVIKEYRWLRVEAENIVEAGREAGYQLGASCRAIRISEDQSAMVGAVPVGAG